MKNNYKKGKSFLKRKEKNFRNKKIKYKIVEFYIWKDTLELLRHERENRKNTWNLNDNVYYLVNFS